ncbi:alpha/beta fold hydrolase [Pseudofulvimonas gallinarii]|jgi:alpha-beta hydrolase superfamily lysophospholipase|uniref:Alpha/beta superfamily hydrolase n=1 Tax=Pseudofulvimonas gallinarii TaxID=634155 RepID=A0A4V6NZF6_9GAMM|nr:alpha/beta fold hydrolase [Pseudofulvimonas gallinarii]TCT01278.1 alpha/beta superfamily hydrolase [Pseudofulvimonas gallinarii]THD15040.1 hypothetical protein B1808_01160 [Pseudofulvimonas gallinarii]
MKGQVLLSHGMESGPQANKVSALAAVAEARGWRSSRPDFRDLDATRDVRRLESRIERLLASVEPGQPLVLAGSSLGAFCSARASLSVPCRGVFLIAPPLGIPGFPLSLDLPAVRAEIVHAWGDELIPAADVVAFASRRRLPLHLLDDNHRLEAHVDVIAALFDRFLGSCE